MADTGPARQAAWAAAAWLLGGWMAWAFLGPHPQPKARWLAEALAVLGCGLLLCPAWRGGPAGLAGWCALLAAGLPAHGLLAGAPLPPLLDLALGVFLLGLALHGAVSALAPQNPAAPGLALCAFAALCALPVWLGPWMEWLAGHHPAAFQAALWACPMGYLAVLLDYDVLREQWFYQHTPFGMLRYDYPDAGRAGLALAAASALLLGRRPARPRSEQPPIPTHAEGERL